MKQTATNSFSDGLNLDLHPIVTPNTVLTDNLNGTFITYNGNEFCLQNDRGNRQVASLTPGYTSIGIKEHNGILYIVSVKGNKTEIGTFPSPQYPETWTDDLYETPDDLINVYSPLHVLKNHVPLTEQILEYDTKHPVTIEIQDSYDGSVNLIIVANGCKPRIINSGFSVLPNNQYKFVNRKQSVDTNIYNEDVFNKDTELIRTSDILTNINLLGVKEGGQFKGGNYTFYIKFGDADYNQTDVVAESGIVSIFNGNDGVPSTISGTLSDERTDKMVNLEIRGLNHIYSKIYIYYSREYSDTQGYRMTEYGMFNEPIDMDENANSQSIWLTGFEQMVPINSEELNVDYHTIDSARAEAQHSNMLFLGNVGQEETFKLYQELEKLCLDNIKVSILDRQYAVLKETDYDYSTGCSEYYYTKNIYNYVGYWPKEIYRFGIVFILKDGSKTPVFNVRGGSFNKQLNGQGNDKWDNKKGVFLMPDWDIYKNGKVIPLALNFAFASSVTFPESVIGWFVVRQKRIPNSICQGILGKSDMKSHIPLIKSENEKWITQSFISCNRTSDSSPYDVKLVYNGVSDENFIRNTSDRLRPSSDNSGFDHSVVRNGGSSRSNTSEVTPIYQFDWKLLENAYDLSLSNVLFSLDPCVNSSISEYLDGSIICIEPFMNCSTLKDEYSYRYSYENIDKSSESAYYTNAVYVPQNTKMKMIGEHAFSTIAGNSSDASSFSYFTTPGFINPTSLISGESATYAQYLSGDGIEESMRNKIYKISQNINLIRGNFCPIIGLADSQQMSFGTYTLKLKDSLSEDTDLLVRSNDSSEFYCISEYKSIYDTIAHVYRGDCFTNTVTLRVIANFIDPTAPTSETIIDENCWAKWVVNKKVDSTNDDDRVQYDQVNLSDVNTVDLGLWITFKCLSSYNLGLRSIDPSHTDEMSLLGSPRTFYPLNGASTVTGNKMQESFLLNDGLSATVGRKRYNLLPDIPYSKSEFANRIMFSNVNVTDAFTNGYRTFQGLAYKDYDKQYGAITKLISLGQNIFIVMEHGLGLVPVNPKALMQTTTGEAIHIYGYGVLPDEMTIISQDYGSKYEHSVIRTPIGIYGLDVDAKKIWRFSDKQGFETISDMKIETYLKDNLKSQEIEMGKSDIRTHYNGKKGDLMFTWYRNGEIYSICYNERQNLWVTRYDWTPIVSENINDEFYSLNVGKNDTDYSIWDHHYEVGKENEYVSTWYDNDKGFEFEFVVSDPIGINKIFENLQIISNNVSPEELQITVIGDDYTFKRDEIAPIYERKEYPDNVTWTTSNIHKNDKEYRELENTVYKWDWRLHQMAIVNTQKLRDIYKYGRRLGNMQYKNGMWFIQIDPLRLNINVPQQKKEVRIRDKWAKIRIRYSGKDLAIITAIRTLINV